MPIRRPDIIFDLETTGLQYGYGSKRDLGILEYAMVPGKVGDDVVSHKFTDLLHGPFERYRQRLINREQLINILTTESPYFTKGALIANDVENTLLKRMANAYMSNVQASPEANVITTMMETLAAGKSVGGWNIGFDIGVLSDAAERHGIKGFRSTWAKAVSRGQIVDMAEGVHRFMYEEFISDRMPLMHRAPSGFVAGTMQSRMTRLELAKAGNEEALSQLEELVQPHEGFLKLKSKQSEINTFMRERLTGMDETARKAIGFNLAPEKFDIGRYKHYESYLQHMNLENIWDKQAFYQGTQRPSIRYTLGWSTETLREALGPKKVDMRVGMRAGITTKELEWSIHDPKYDVLFEKELSDLFGHYRGPANMKDFEHELYKRYGTTTEAFKEGIRRASITHGEELNLKRFVKQHKSAATELARFTDRAHIQKLMDDMLETHRTEGAVISAGAHTKATGYLNTVPGGFLSSGLRQGFKKGYQEVAEAATRLARKHPKMAMSLGIASGVMLLNSIIPSPKDRRPEPYDDISGLRYTYNPWQLITGMHPSNMAPSTDFGSGYDFFGRSVARAKLALTSRFYSIRGFVGQIFGAGVEEQRFAISESLNSSVVGKINALFRPTVTDNKGPTVAGLHNLSRAPLTEKVAAISEDLAHARRTQYQTPRGFYHDKVPQGHRTTDLNAFIDTPTSFYLTSDYYRPAHANDVVPPAITIQHAERRGFPKMLSDLATDAAIKDVGDFGARSLDSIQSSSRVIPQLYEVSPFLDSRIALQRDAFHITHPGRISAGYIRPEAAEAIMAKASARGRPGYAPMFMYQPIELPPTFYNIGLASRAAGSGGYKNFPLAPGPVALEGIRSGYPGPESSYMQTMGINRWPYGFIRSGVWQPFEFLKKLWGKGYIADETDTLLKESGYSNPPKRPKSAAGPDITAEFDVLEAQFLKEGPKSAKKLKRLRSFRKNVAGHFLAIEREMATDKAMGRSSKWEKYSPAGEIQKTAGDYYREFTAESLQIPSDEALADAQKLMGEGRYTDLKKLKRTLLREIGFQKFIKTGAYLNRKAWPRAMERVQSKLGLTDKQMMEVMEEYAKGISFERLEGSAKLVELELRNLTLSKGDALFSHIFTGGSIALGEHYAIEHYDKLMDILKKRGYSEHSAHYIIQQEYGIKPLLGMNYVNDYPKGVKGILARIAGTGRRKVVAETPKGTISMDIPSSLPNGKEFFGEWARGAKAEALAYPRLLKALWKQKVPLFEKAWRIGSVLFGRAGFRSAAMLEGIIDKFPQWVDPVEKAPAPSGSPSGWTAQTRNALISIGGKIRKLSGIDPSIKPIGKPTIRARAVDAAGKTVQRLGLMHAFAALGLYTSWSASDNYESRLGGFLTELTAYGASWPVYTLAERTIYGSYKTGMVHGIAKKLKFPTKNTTLLKMAAGQAKAGPWWARLGAFVASQIVGYYAMEAVHGTITDAGHAVFGTRSQLPPGQMIPMNQDAMMSHIVSSSIISGTSFPGVHPGGMNMTPFGSGFDPNRVPELKPPEVRQPVKRIIHPKTAGLPMRLWENRNSSRITKRTLNPPRQRVDRGIAA